MKVRRIMTSLIVLMVSMQAAVLAQAPQQTKRGSYQGQGYSFFGIGAVNAEDTILHFGGGVEAVISKGLGIGAEIGFLAPHEYLSEGIGVFSLNGYYELRQQPASKVIPFFTGGYSLLFRQGTLNAVNFGGGIHYWFHKKLGLRFEIRDHLSPSCIDVHVWQGRVGIEFR